MFVRFQGAVFLAVLVAIGGSSVENATLDRRRAIGRQHYRLDVLQEQVARLRLNAEELGAPSRLARPVQDQASDVAEATGRSAYNGGVGLSLRWRVVPEQSR